MSWRSVSYVSATGTKNLPIVATTLKRPVATRSISASICCSVEEGEFNNAYVECAGRLGAGAGPGEAGVVVFDGGRSENSDGEGAMNERY